MTPAFDVRTTGLPVATTLPALRLALRDRGLAVVLAPPGAGKTTVAPLALLDEPWLEGRRIILLEPRRLAARAAAHRMARLLDEPVGRSVGYRTRLETRVSAVTRLEVVTEGVLTRITQRDPTLEEYALVIFDEFHERSLQADVGLALALHARRLVRPDLRILVMSATLDGAAVARLLGDAPVLESAGRQHPVETRYRPLRTGAGGIGHIAGGVASAIRDALASCDGDLLAFLPGAPEVRAAQRALDGEELPPGVDVIPLHGMLRPEDQDRAIAPSRPGRRKVVLATAIAETSLTIDGVRVVVDSGLARRPRFSPRTGMSRLETTRVTLASADQRRGRAGRVAPGLCIRLWDEAEQAALLPFAPPEIADGDLAPLVLDLALAGVTDPADLAWLDAPPAAAWAQAVELLRQLRALDGDARVTAHGRSMAMLGMHPRLSHMVLRAREQGHGALACDIAALLGERDPLRADSRDVGADLRLRLDALAEGTVAGAGAGALRRIREQARRWRGQLSVPAGGGHQDAAGRVLALAFPDRVAQRRPGPAGRYLLRNGTGALLPELDPLAREPWLVVAESDGRSPEARVYLAAPLDADDLERELGDQVEEREVVTWDDDAGVRARCEQRLGAILLASRAVPTPDPGRVAEAVSGAIRRRGLDILPWTEAATRLRQRLAFLHRYDARAWPDMGEPALTDAVVAHLQDQLGTVRSAGALRRIDVSGALLSLLDWRQRGMLDQHAPTHYVAPTGSRLPIDYADPDVPVVRVRLQELFGCAVTPAVMDGRVPLTLHLLSPANRPVQVTRDLAGFWRSSYFDVRRDLRARYPRHPWPENPLSARPTSRARPRR